MNMYLAWIRQRSEYNILLEIQLFGKLRNLWKDNIRTNLWEMRPKVNGRMKLLQYRVHWRVLIRATFCYYSIVLSLAMETDS
jgi:hypothetical protein